MCILADYNLQRMLSCLLTRIRIPMLVLQMGAGNQADLCIHGMPAKITSGVVKWCECVCACVLAPSLRHSNECHRVP